MQNRRVFLAGPQPHADIILGKSLASILLIALQVGIWILILLITGFAIKNPLLVYAFILMASVPIVGITTALSVYAKNYKEAGIGISILYIGVAGFLAVPALAYISTRSTLANVSPMTVVMSSVVTDPALLDHYGASRALAVGISENLSGSTLAEDLEAQNLNLYYYKDLDQAKKLLGTRLVAVVEVSPAPEQNVTVDFNTANVFYPVISTKVSNAITKFKTDKRLESAGLNASQIQKVENMSSGASSIVLSSSSTL